MRSRPRRARPLGFTIVEMMIVILLIALLVAIAIPAFLRAQAYARRLTCKNNLRQIHAALATYALAHGGLLPTNEPGGEDKYPWPPGRETPRPLREDVSTNLIGWRGNTPAARQQGRVPWGLGKLHAELGEDLGVLFCPTDGTRDATAYRQVFRNDGMLDSGDTPHCSYLYRGRDAPDKTDTAAIRLFRSPNDSVRALAMDYYVGWWGCPDPNHASVHSVEPGNCPICGKTLREVSLWRRYHDERICVLFEDGSALDVRVSRRGAPNRFVDPRDPDPAKERAVLDRIWRRADLLYESDD
jgi:prepilin-type N-terminal cleavage/methylation domain-containing protein